MNMPRVVVEIDDEGILYVSVEISSRECRDRLESLLPPSGYYDQQTVIDETEKLVTTELKRLIDSGELWLSKLGVWLYRGSA